MSERLPRHPIARRYPADPPARIEINVQKPYNSKDAYIYQGDGVVCNCFPRTSKATVPSMFYDEIKCPHQNMHHIQPAQETQFNYPWTADSLGRQRARGDPDHDGDSLQSDRLSLISEEDEELRFTPAFLRQRMNPDILSITTAPPFRFRKEMDPRINPPFTAPNEKTKFDTRVGRAQSLTDVRDRRHRLNVDNRNRYYNHTSQDSQRQFTGSYVDPKDGKVYQYNVNYGKQSIDGQRRPQPRRKAQTPAV